MIESLFSVLVKVDSHAMREMNRALVLEMIRRETTVSRSDLARRSALTKPTVSSIVDVLIGEGLVCEVGFGSSHSRKGRRSRLLQLNDAAAAFLGVHFGVRHTSIAVADARGQIRHTATVESFRGRFEQAILALPALVKSVFREARLSRSRLAAVGVAIPGLVDQTSGTCVLAPNLRWFDAPVKDELGIDRKSVV